MSLATEIAAAAAPTAPPATPEGTPAPAAGPNGNGSPPNNGSADTSARWLVPEEYKHETMNRLMDDKGTVDVAAMAKSYIHAQSLIGRDKIVIPKGDDEWKEVYSKLGCPDDPSKYEVKKPEQMPEGITYNEEGEKTLRNFGVANGWNQKQFAAAYEQFHKHQAEQAAQYAQLDKQARDECEANLRRELGQTFDGFAGQAKAALSQYADPDFFAFLDSKGLGNDPRMIRVFGRIGKELAGDTALKGGGGAPAGMTPREIEEKITTLTTDHHDALFNGEHPDHKKYKDEWDRLFKLKHNVK
jgi:hypothetical protein